MSFSKLIIKLRLPSKLKGIFFVLRLDRLVPIHLFNLIAHMAQLSKWISVHKKTCDNDFYNPIFNYKNRESLYKRVVADHNLDSNIDYLEFGVSAGISFRWWVDQIKDSDARFYGFDTFTGLPEDWGRFKKGDMGNNNKPPVISDDSRHQFYQGLFQQTLLPFLSEYKTDKRKVIHMDADIYSATLYVLTLMSPFIKKGDIILFDEFNVPLHEFKAFNEWTKSFYINYKVLYGVNNFYQTAILIQ
ncbi:MAG: macrocin O-methyltransferase [Bacteroidetes bacterium]|nr:MAG: macrocin O-methyltransferase [Bacteroidota bacterium]